MKREKRDSRETKIAEWEMRREKRNRLETKIVDRLAGLWENRHNDIRPLFERQVMNKRLIDKLRELRA